MVQSLEATAHGLGPVLGELKEAGLTDAADLVGGAMDALIEAEAAMHNALGLEMPDI